MAAKYYFSTVPEEGKEVALIGRINVSNSKGEKIGWLSICSDEKVEQVFEDDVKVSDAKNMYEDVCVGEDGYERVEYEEEEENQELIRTLRQVITQAVNDVSNADPTDRFVDEMTRALISNIPPPSTRPGQKPHDKVFRRCLHLYKEYTGEELHPSYEEPIRKETTAAWKIPHSTRISLSGTEFKYIPIVNMAEGYPSVAALVGARGTGKSSLTCKIIDNQLAALPQGKKVLYFTVKNAEDDQDPVLTMLDNPNLIKVCLSDEEVPEDMQMILAHANPCSILREMDVQFVVFDDCFTSGTNAEACAKLAKNIADLGRSANISLMYTIQRIVAKNKDVKALYTNTEQWIFFPDATGGKSVISLAMKEFLMLDKEDVKRILVPLVLKSRWFVLSKRYRYFGNDKELGLF
jgi:hypothetical protein